MLVLVVAGGVWLAVRAPENPQGEPSTPSVTSSQSFNATIPGIGAAEEASTTPQAPAPVPPALTVPQVPAAVTVAYTDAGFSPATVTVANGGTVTFQNNSSRAFRPASDPHPAHSGYPEPGTCNGHSFDPCGAVPVGAMWSFTFHASGTWGYHDHMNSGKKGMVVVK